jgi:putative ABC transport system substrate-binding protein
VSVVDARRRAFAACLAGAALAPGRVLAQPSDRIPRVGLLVAETVAGQKGRIDALLAGLRELGRVDGTSIALEVRAADGRYDRLPALARELVRVPVDVIVAFGIKALVAAREATSVLPIVIPSTSSDPVAMGMIGNLSRHEGNITGSVTVGPEIMAKRLELLKEVAPAVSRVAVLVNTANASFAPTMRRMERSAAALRVTVVRAPVSAPSELGRTFGSIAQSGPAAIVVQDDTMFAVNAGAVAELARRHRLPSAGSTAFAEAGGVVGYGASDLALYRRGAYFVDRILRGTKPGDLPIEQATRFELAINARTAHALGLAIPETVLARADRVVE